MNPLNPHALHTDKDNRNVQTNEETLYPPEYHSSAGLSDHTPTPDKKWTNKAINDTDAAKYNG